MEQCLKNEKKKKKQKTKKKNWKYLLRSCGNGAEWSNALNIYVLRTQRQQWVQQPWTKCSHLFYQANARQKP